MASSPDDRWEHDDTPTTVRGSSLAAWLVPLVATALLAPLSNGRWTVPATAWLAPLFGLRFVREQRPWRGLAGLYLVYLAWFPVQWASQIPLEGAGLWLLALGMELLYLIPFALDRWLGPRRAGFASTLVFPLAWTSLEYWVAVVSPYTTWGSLAYTQFDNLPLLQLSSLTGLYGVTFLVSWFASVGNWCWEQDPRSRRAWAGLLGYGAVVAAVLVLGGMRMELFPPGSPTVRVASLTVEHGPARRIWNLRREGTAPTAIAAVRRATHRLHAELFERSTTAARSGAQLVFWAELNGLVLHDDETALIERGRELARREGVFLGMSLGTITPGKYLMENQLLLIDPAGDLVATYHKARPVPGDPETGASPAIPVIDTPHGRWALGICYDLDFPDLGRQAGRAGADLMIVPARDSAAMSPGHTRMAILRAIENGMNLVRQTDTGWSAAVDYQGRVLASLDHFQSGERVMFAEVPGRGATTLYARIGDVFAWACLAGLTAFASRAAVRYRTFSRR